MAQEPNIRPSEAGRVFTNEERAEIYKDHPEHLAKVKELIRLSEGRYKGLEKYGFQSLPRSSAADPIPDSPPINPGHSHGGYRRISRKRTKKNRKNRRRYSRRN